MCNLDGHYAADSVAAAAAETTHDGDGSSGLVLPNSTQRGISKVPLLQGKSNDAHSTSNMSRNFR